jgi:hypothetical protein
MSKLNENNTYRMILTGYKNTKESILYSMGEDDKNYKEKLHYNQGQLNIVNQIIDDMDRLLNEDVKPVSE